jgi:Zn-dependent protease with chaperone function
MQAWSGEPSAARLPLIHREQRRRRALFLAIVAAILLGVSPVLGHHVLGSVPWFSASQQHLGVFCLVALHLLLAPVHGFAHYLLYAGLAYMLIERGSAFVRHAGVMRALPQRPVEPGSMVAEAAARSGLGLGQLRVVDGLPAPAFVSGWLAPRVFVAADLPERLDADELAAVLAHEAVHLRRRDPLRLFALRALASVLFWLPALRRVAADVEDEWEITADDEAARQFALPLATAILRLGGGDPGVAEPAVGFQRADLLPRRIRRLAGEAPMPLSHLSRRSIGAAAVALLLVWSSGVMVLHPLTDPSAMDPTAPPAHCDHAHESAFSHLFCRGFAWGPDVRDAKCPHEPGSAFVGESAPVRTVAP